MLRRSSSSSNIPVFKNDTRGGGRPKSSFSNNSAKKIRGSSCDRVPVIKRSTSSLSGFKKSHATTTPTVPTLKPFNLKKSVGTTPTAGSSLFKRSSNIVTPASSRSRSKSPYKIGSDRTATDKKLVMQHFAKVCQFLQEHKSCQDHVPDIKPPTINTFVFVMNILLKEIDPRVALNTTNYKEVVLKTLKMLHYPGNISASLLKTVNTMHAWSNVINIFAWLIDLITIIRIGLPINPRLEEDHKYKIIQCITDYIVDRHKSYNDALDIKVVDDMFEEEFARILNIDNKEIELLEQELNTIAELNQKQSEKISDQNEKNDALKKKTEILQNEINIFYSCNEKQEDINCAIELLKARRRKLVESIKVCKNNKEVLNEAIKIQPCTIIEKKRMMKHIEEMKHTIDLKKDKIKEQWIIKNDWEMKVMEAKKKVEKEVYRLNNNVMKLVTLEPKLKELHLKEQYMFLPNFRQEIQHLIKNIQVFEKNFNYERTQTMQAISKMKMEICMLEQQLADAQKTKQDLINDENCVTQEIETYKRNTEIKSKEKNQQVNHYLTKIKELNEIGTNIDNIREECNQLIILKHKKEMEFENLKEQSLQFFVKLHNIIMENFVDMNEIRTDIFDVLKECLSKVDQAQVNIFDDIYRLRAVLDQAESKFDRK